MTGCWSLSRTDLISFFLTFLSQLMGLLNSSAEKPILGDPGATSRDEAIFLAKVYFKS